METILVSKCLLGIRCSYQGHGHRHTGVLALGLQYNILAVCPELEGGLPIPREGVTIREGRAIGRESGKDYTKEYLAGAAATLSLVQKLGITKAYMLENSPSCGKGYGITAKLLAANGVEVIAVQRPHEQLTLLCYT
jgi:uncharacterized protein YbbK (DUF523 family)